MAWRRQSHELKQDIRQVEQRLAEIAEAQSELSRNSEEIKGLTAKIVTTLNSGISNDLLGRLISNIETIPSLLQGMAPNKESVEAQFADLHQSQLKIQNDISHVIALITDLTALLSRGA
jgi:ABC-type transporter Mla subunit MlaD